jgi:hypothetical protein
MPHRNNKDMEELEKSLKVITKENNNNNIMIAGDFNYPDIQWETLLLNREAIDKEVQRTLIDITSQSGPQALVSVKIIKCNKYHILRQGT